MFLKTIELTNLLSFGHMRLEIEPLNVLIGPNAAGKSNLLRTLRLVKSLPGKDDLSRAIAEGGGVAGWINRRITGAAWIRLSSLGLPSGLNSPFDYFVSLRPSIRSYEIVSEELAGEFTRQLDQCNLVSSRKTLTGLSLT